jgi:hypothetical protein
VSDNGEPSYDTYAGPTMPGAMGASMRGPVGRTTNVGTQILLTIVTFGIWALVWTYRQYEDFKNYTGEGLGGGVGLVLGIFVWPVTYFIIPNELAENVYRPEGEQCPVSAIYGLWFLLPIVGGIIWYIQVQHAINDFWERRGAAPA